MTEPKGWITVNGKHIPIYDNWSDSLNESQLEAFEEYMGTHSDIIRKASMGESDNEDAKSYARLISKALDNSNISSTKVSTGFDEGHTELFGKTDMSYNELKNMEGKSIVLKGFLSGTIGTKVHPAYKSKNGIELFIDVPSGKGIGASLKDLESKVSSANVKGEDEFLFNNKGSLEIISVYKLDDNIKIKAKYKKGN